MDNKFYYYIVIGGLYYGFKFWQNYKKKQATKLIELQKKQAFSETPIFQPVSKPKTKLEELFEDFGVEMYDNPETIQSFELPETSIKTNQIEERTAYEQSEAKSPFENKGLLPEDYYDFSKKNNRSNKSVERLVDKSRFHGYKSQEILSKRTDTLRTKNGLRNALIVSEILKPKF